LQPSSLAVIAMSELGAARAELQRKTNYLRTASQKHDELLQYSSAESEEAVNSELAVAKAELGVATAKLGVAEAELDEAKRKEATPERKSEIAELKGEIAELKEDVTLAELKKAAAQAKSDGDKERLKRMQEAVDAKISAPRRLGGQHSATLFALNFCTSPVSTTTYHGLVLIFFFDLDLSGRLPHAIHKKYC
jgi:ABC-type Na+ efflux pump permease subunit